MADYTVRSDSPMSDDGILSAFRPVPRTGVIYVTTEAERRGFRTGDPDVVQPRPGPARDRRRCPARRRASQQRRDRRRRSGVRAGRRASGSCARRSPASTTSSSAAACRRSTRAENVSVSGGGRAALTRAAAALGHINLGHFLPDYTAYEELLDIFRRSRRSRSCSRASAATRFSADDLRREVHGPRPVGAAAVEPVQPDRQGDRRRRARRAGCDVARELDCALLLDEFYSHYIWTAATPRRELAVESAARYVEDVDRDPVVIFDGLTKNWRYPGWRVTWTVGPQEGDRGGRQRRLVPRRRRLASRCSAPRSPLLDDAHVAAETNAIQRRSARSAIGCSPACARLGIDDRRAARRHVLRLGQVGALPPPLDDGMGFFRAALDKQVITVPGEFFDVNPGKRRQPARLPLPPPRALLVRPVAGDAGHRARRASKPCSRASALPQAERRKGAGVRAAVRPRPAKRGEGREG